MTNDRSTQQMLVEVRRMATAGGCFVSPKDGRYRVFRKTAGGAVYLGFRTTPAALRSFVLRLVAIH
jgi:hypothetical protein